VWKAAEGITPGDEPGPTYRPAAPVTRAAMSAFLYRSAGEPTFEPPGPPIFADVSTGHPFYAEISWMADAGISTGYADDTYRPSSQVTRQAMSAFLYRSAGEPTSEPPGPPTFADVSTGHPFYAEIEWMAAEAISTGYLDGTYRPEAPVTRAAMSAFLYRAADAPSTSPLPAEDRAALVTVLGTESTPITDPLLDQRLGDLFALVLSTTTFQHR